MKATPRHDKTWTEKAKQDKRGNTCPHTNKNKATYHQVRGATTKMKSRGKLRQEATTEAETTQDMTTAEKIRQDKTI